MLLLGAVSLSSPATAQQDNTIQQEETIQADVTDQQASSIIESWPDKSSEVALR